MSLQEEEQPRSSDQLRASDKENESVASKLSKELNNWRRKRSHGHGPRRHEDAPNQSFQSGAARTIKVRGHETLVVRKTKSVVKPSSPQASNRTNS